MFLPKPPKSMSDDELCDWASSLINRRAPESSSLDYKAYISPLEKQSDKIELAKDISSFANGMGGVLLYGVPKEKQNNVPIPKPLSECGIEFFTFSRKNRKYFTGCYYTPFTGIRHQGIKHKRIRYKIFTHDLSP